MSFNTVGHIGAKGGFNSAGLRSVASGVNPDSIFSDFGFLNMWTALNITEGAQMIAHDYGGEHDLTTDAGDTNPTVNTSSSTFGNRQSLSFTGTQGLEKAVANWRGSDNLGVMTWIIEPVATRSSYAICSADSATNGAYYWGNVNLGSANFYRGRSGGSSTTVDENAQSNATRMPRMVVSVKSNGSAFSLFLNGILINHQGAGTAGGWGNDFSLRDNISIGKMVDLTPGYGQMEWCMSGYHNTAVSDANIVLMHQQWMTYYGMTHELAMSELNDINPILNGWNYKWNYVNGTTTSLPDLAGDYRLENSAAAGQPTLNATNLEFDGVANEINDVVANYRSGDSTGVISLYVDFDTVAGNPIIFSSSDNGSNTEYLIVQLRSGGEVRLQSTLGSSVILETTATWTGWHVVSCVQDGVQAYIFVDGVKVLAYDTSTLTTDWFDLSTANDGIALGAMLDLTPNYGASKIKYVGYSAYVNDATVTLEADKILNSGL
jgi:hypothetical protein